MLGEKKWILEGLVQNIFRTSVLVHNGGKKGRKYKANTSLFVLETSGIVLLRSGHPSLFEQASRQEHSNIGSPQELYKQEGRSQQPDAASLFA